MEVLIVRVVVSCIVLLMQLDWSWQSLGRKLHSYLRG